MDPSLYTYPSPLEGFEHLPPISMYARAQLRLNYLDGSIKLSSHRDAVKHGHGTALVNEQTGVLSTAYERFVGPIRNDDRGGFDVHVYFFQVRAPPTLFIPHAMSCPS